MINRELDDRARRLFRRRHALLPGVLFAGLFAIVILGQLDLRIADEFFFSRLANLWIGAQTWWAVDLIHTGGGWFVRLIGLAALTIFLSHDLASAAIAWFVLLALWRLLLASGSRQEPGCQPSVASSSPNPAT
jgi:membrane-associated PAP2 superfamily phosphatase